MLIRNEYVVRNFSSMSELTIGMDRQSVHSLFPEAPVVRPNVELFPVVEFYPQRMLRFEYDTLDALAYIEVGPPNSVTLEGIELLDRSIEDVAQDLRGIGFELRQEQDPTCYSFNEMLTLWVDDEEIKAISLRTAEYTRQAALALATIRNERP